MLRDVEHDGEELSVDQFKAALTTAVQLLGNASAQVSRLRRRKILKAINPEIQDLAYEDIFSSSAPYLFGEEFEPRMKSRAESLKILSSAKTPHSPRRNSFFEGAAPLPPKEEATRNEEGSHGAPRRANRPNQGSDFSSEGPCMSRQRLTYIMHKSFDLSEYNTRYFGQKGDFTTQSVTQDSWVIETVKGYRLELLSEPIPRSPPKKRVTLSSEQSLVEEEILKLQSKGVVTELAPKEENRGFFSSLFLVPKKDKGMRLVINFKNLNEFVVPRHFKMKGLHTLRDLIRKNDWMTKLDLKDAYFTIHIHSSSRPALRLSNHNCLYQFTSGLLQ
uniref:Reverse transcriptase domain-containing protein n=1 Tax=Amphimedon queenslandica TaxID=400682 RepID=A0A1X7UC19_AMPQE